MSRAIRSHLGDFIAILLLVAVGLATTGYILSNERLRFWRSRSVRAVDN